MFQTNKIYKHRSCLDIVFLVDKIERKKSEHSPTDDYVLEGKWLNRHYDLIYICDETLTIPATKLDQWVEFKTN